MGMSIIRKSRRQKAVYWSNPSSDGRGGLQTDLPVEIDCRWENEVQVVKLSTGKEYVSMTQVYVDRDIDEQGFLHLGTLDSLDGVTDHKKVSDTHEIMKYAKLPVLRVRTDGLDPNADEYLRTVWL